MPDSLVICGTGHRPDKLGGYDPGTYARLVVLAEEWLSNNKVMTVISGGALGWDQALADAALNRNVTLHLYLPFPGFEDRWYNHNKINLYSQMTRAEKVKYVCEPGYAGYKMQKRNEAMVDSADLVLALWNGSKGGTGNCVNYANKVKKPIVNLWDMYSV